MTAERDYLLEFRSIGNTVKVSAIDPETGTEVSIVGPATASEEELSRVAVSKLEYVLRRKAGDRDADDADGNGVLV